MRTSKQEIARYTWLAPRQLAEELSCDADLVRDHIRAGHFPDVDGQPGVIDVGTGKVPQYRIHPKSFEMFKRERGLRR